MGGAREEGGANTGVDEGGRVREAGTGAWAGTIEMARVKTGGRVGRAKDSGRESGRGNSGKSSP